MAQANRITRFGADIDLVSRRLLLVAGSAAATNCLLELKKDAVTARTPARLLPRGRLGPAEPAAFAVALGAAGLAVLYTLANPLTMWLMLATFVGGVP